MGETSYVHIVDEDSARRAQIARQLYAKDFHAEIYESVDELLSRPPGTGAILISDDQECCDVDTSLQAITERTGYLPVALFSANPSPRKIVRAMASGAMNYLGWPCSPEELENAVVALVTTGEQKARLERRKLEARGAIAKLSGRERDVLAALVQGGINKEIAQQLGISPRTVEIHRANMMRRLNAQSVADAVRIGLYAGLHE